MFKWLAAAAAAIVVLPLALVLAVAVGAASSTTAGPFGGSPSILADKDIPPPFLALYMDAAQTCPGLPWAVLAGIGKIESDHGRSNAPGVHSGSNRAGAEGPMQFLPATFAAYAADGDHDGTLNVYDPADAIFTAAAMLCANGAASGTPGGLSQAVYAYNHSQAYVADVFTWAARYAAPAPIATGSNATVSRIAAQAIAFALAQLGKPYVWGAAGPDAYDCRCCPEAARMAPGHRDDGRFSNPRGASATHQVHGRPASATQPSDLQHRQFRR
ncbi:MAG: lytic transglycosylase domain-containing protein [Micromonosporaceae bacterium]